MSTFADTAQRWRDGRDSYRPADDQRFNPTGHEVSLVSGNGEVNPFVVRHHYAHAVPNSGRFRFALHEGSRLVGVAIFGIPGGPTVLKSSFPFLGAPSQEAVELQRLVLLDEVLKNGESWFVSRCFKALKQEGVEAVVSFSDPVARYDGTKVIMPGHVGCVYQALSAWYTGRSKAAWAWYLANGYQINRRDVTKVQQSCSCCGTGRSTSGARGALERIIGWGARVPRRNECRRSWVKSVLPQIAERRRHGGNHRYVWGLAKPARKGLARIHGAPDASVYPKKVDA